MQLSRSQVILNSFIPVEQRNCLYGLYHSCPKHVFLVFYSRVCINKQRLRSVSFIEHLELSISTSAVFGVQSKVNTSVVVTRQLSAR
jgi:hypothetical protein